MDQRKQLDQMDQMDKVENGQNEGGKQIRRFIRRAVRSLMGSSFQVIRKGEELARIPAAVFALLLLFTYHVAVPVMVLALFFQVRYRFTGDLGRANEWMDKASDFAEEVKERFFPEGSSRPAQM